jgi:hypothetical protein
MCGAVMAKKARSVRVSDELWASVAAKAKREGRTISQVIVAALFAYLKD